MLKLSNLFELLLHVPPPIDSDPTTLLLFVTASLYCQSPLTAMCSPGYSYPGHSKFCDSLGPRSGNLLTHATLLVLILSSDIEPNPNPDLSTPM